MAGRKPPERALHGPFYRGGRAKEAPSFEPLRPAEKEAILEAVRDGTCDCACCKVRGNCRPLPEAGWAWCRQPTPKQKREGMDARPLTWPVWIYAWAGIG